jgi:hypothetical protein
MCPRLYILVSTLLGWNIKLALFCFFLRRRVQTSFGAHKVSCIMGSVALSSGQNGQGREANHPPSGHAMAQAIIRLRLTAEARVRARVVSLGIYGWQSGTGTGFPPSSSAFPVGIVPPWLFILTVGPLVAAVQRQSHPIDTKNSPPSCGTEVKNMCEGITCYALAWRST